MRYDQRLYEDGDYQTTGVAALDYTDWQDPTKEDVHAGRETAVPARAEPRNG